MNRPAHDLRLLGAACVSWAALAIMLALRLGDSAYLVVVLALTALTCVGALIVLTRGGGGRRTRWSVLALAVATIVTSAASVHLARQHSGPVSMLAAAHATMRAEAVVTGQPHRAVVERGDELFVVPVTLVELDARGRHSRIATPAVVLGDAHWKDVGWRAHVEIRGRLAPSLRLGAAEAVVRVSGPPRVLAGPPRVVEALEPVRQGLRHAAGALPADARGLLPALVVGDGSALPDDLLAAMNATGMSHLNAVSGSNVTIVLVATMWLLGWTGLGARGRFVAALVALAAYVLMCRPEPSVVRAAAMGAVGLTGTTWGRPRAACPTLGAAIVVLLVWDPWLAISAGFALSALATLGLVLFARTWAQAVVRRWGARWPARAHSAVELICIPLAAQVLCLPILVALSGSISWVSIPANVLAEPFVAPATLGGMAVALLAPWWPGAAGLLVWLPGLPSWAIALVARGASRVPGGAIPWPPGVWGVVAALAVVVVLLCAGRLLRWLGAAGLACLVATGAVPAAVLVAVPGEDAAPPRWVYAQCSVGQGDAALVRTAPGHAIAIDVGPRDGQITRCLRRHRISVLDAVVLTHFHADHVGGLEEAFDAVGPAPVYTTWVTEDSGAPGLGAAPGLAKEGAVAGRHHGEQGAKPSVDATVRARGMRLVSLAPGQGVAVGDTHLEVLWPRRVVHAGSVQNNASLVLDVTSPRLHALMLGDCEREAQDAVTADVALRAHRRRYDVVKVAHHGSANQSPRLYDAARAPLGVVGVGAGNDYGHPAAKTLDMLAAVGTHAERTDLSGDLDVVLVSGAPTIEPQR